MDARRLRLRTLALAGLVALVGVGLAGCGDTEVTVVAPVRVDLRGCLTPEPEGGGLGLCGSALQERTEDGRAACLAFKIGPAEQVPMALTLQGNRLVPAAQREIELPQGVDLSFKVFLLQQGANPSDCADYTVDTTCKPGGEQPAPATCLLALAARKTRVSGDKPVVITYGTAENPCGTECNDPCPPNDPECVRVCYPSAAATAELCNGRDDDCDGEIDEGFEVGAECASIGHCGAGVWECACTAEACPAADASGWGERVCSSGPGGSDDRSTAERCNAEDDDCDGSTDEDFALTDAEGNPLAVGDACVSTGVCGAGQVECAADDPDQASVLCSSGPGGSRYSEAIDGEDVGGREVQCDGQDDDCDGETDEGWGVNDGCPAIGGPGSPCGAGVWECDAAGGERICSTHPGGSAYAGRAELCNGADDDCDGAVDEGLGVGEDCVLPGVCGAGVWRCDDRGGTECDSVDASGPELCNDEDDDCDNLVDEDWPDKGEECEVEGECGEGRWICAPAPAEGEPPLLPDESLCCGADPACSGLQPGQERCDGLDNDCDTQTDEDFELGVACDAVGGPGSPCGPGVWECDSQNRDRVCSTHPGGTNDQSSPETCDGRDNDCDGAVDDDPQLPLADLQFGVCGGQRKLCVQGELQEPDYFALDDFEAPELSCDNRDNDCNNEVDRDPAGDRLLRPCYTGDEATRNVGLCREGTETCELGEWLACQQEVLPAAEQCNGLDDDCDTFTDEEWPELNSVCFGEGACSDTPGRIVCNRRDVLEGPTCCNVDPACTGAEPEEELCDGVDNNCNGDVDEGYGLGDACAGVGGAGSPCVEGVLECDPTDPALRSTRCSTHPGSSDPRDQPEVCNAADDDCDGAVDNDPALNLADLQEGVCAGLLKVCGPQGEEEPDYATAVQLPSVYEADSETRCDGEDNDCDGRTDEDAAGDPISEQCWTTPSDHEERGLCEYGTSTCANGEMGACEGEVKPAAEQCNGDDDDCDNATDEGPAGDPLTRACYDEVADVEHGQPATRGVGICSDGEQTCTAGEWTEECVGQVQPEAVDTCNGLDDDCNGLEDTTPSGDPLVQGCYTGAEVTRGVGSCSDGEQVCQGEAGWGRCLGDRTPGEELCNGDDDDCDGATDEDVDGDPMTRSCYSGLEGTAGTGECREGTETCGGGEWQGVCVAEIVPVLEECDGHDEDCDGFTDEDALGDPLAQDCWDGAAGTFPVGLCSSGTAVCAAGEFGACVGAVYPEFEEEPYCDLEDENCDGTEDEPFGGGGDCLLPPADNPDAGSPCGQGTTECFCVVNEACGAKGVDERWAAPVCSTELGGSQFAGEELACGYETPEGVFWDTDDGQANVDDYSCLNEDHAFTGNEQVFAIRTPEDAPRRITVRIDQLSTVDLELIVFRTCTNANSRCVGFSSRFRLGQGNNWDQVIFDSVAGEIYYAVVEGTGDGTTGEYKLSVTCGPVP